MIVVVVVGIVAGQIVVLIRNGLRQEMIDSIFYVIVVASLVIVHAGVFIFPTNNIVYAVVDRSGCGSGCGCSSGRGCGCGCGCGCPPSEVSVYV